MAYYQDQSSNSTQPLKHSIDILYHIRKINPKIHVKIEMIPNKKHNKNTKPTALKPQITSQSHTDKTLMAMSRKLAHRLTE